MTPADTTRGTRARRAARQGVGEATAAPSAEQPVGAALDQADHADRIAETVARPGGAGQVRPARADLDPDALAALEEERDFLLRSLEDLDREYRAGDVDDHDYQELKDDYTARAAAAIRAVDQRLATFEAARPRRSLGRVLAITATVLALALGAGWLVMANAGDRTSGDTITGDIRQSSIDELAKANQYTAEAQQALQDGDGQKAVDAYKKAIDAYDRALQLQPNNVEAMTYRGWLLHNLAVQAPSTTAEGLDQSARQWLDQAISTDPTYPDARIFRAILLEDQGRYADALADLDAVDPAKLPAQMTTMVDTLRTRLTSEAAGSTTTTPAQPGG